MLATQEVLREYSRECDLSGIEFWFGWLGVSDIWGIIFRVSICWVSCKIFSSFLRFFASSSWIVKSWPFTKRSINFCLFRVGSESKLSPRSSVPNLESISLFICFGELFSAQDCNSDPLSRVFFPKLKLSSRPGGLGEAKFLVGTDPLVIRSGIFFWFEMPSFCELFLLCSIIVTISGSDLLPMTIGNVLITASIPTNTLSGNLGT